MALHEKDRVVARHDIHGMFRGDIRLLTVVESAVEDIIEGADGNRRVGRRGRAIGPGNHR
jgi:hypothetical protein